MLTNRNFYIFIFGYLAVLIFIGLLCSCSVNHDPFTPATPSEIVNQSGEVVIIERVEVKIKKEL